MYIDIGIPEAGSRRPIAYSHSNSSKRIYFLFDPRVEGFKIHHTCEDIFWHQNCRDCSYLYQNTCAGGQPYGIPAIRNDLQESYTHSCLHGFQAKVEDIVVPTQLLPHVFAFSYNLESCEDYDEDGEVFFYWDEDSLEYDDIGFYFVSVEDSRLYLQPYYLGNVSSRGCLCTPVAFGEDLEEFLHQLFDEAVWNSDHCYNWLSLMETPTPDYTTSLHTDWLKNHATSESLLNIDWEESRFIGDFTYIDDTASCIRIFLDDPEEL